MSLIDGVKTMCNRLAPNGWGDLLAQHGLDIQASDLAGELSKKLTKIIRNAKGFEDFALEGERGIEPGHPARSLLYHALASPNVLTGVDGSDLKGFPTLQELDTVENYVYGVRPPSIEELRARAANAPLAIVVFASEYRPASQTCHRKHADLVFARTGVSRVGTAEPLFDGRRRGFLPFVEGEAFTLRVCPVRYSVYIAAQVSGDEAKFCPMRFRIGSEVDDGISDKNRKFWQPVHKLFPGSECLGGVQDLQVNLTPHHTNEKLRRVHVELRKKFDTGVNPQDLDKPPFIFSDGIAKFSTNPDNEPGLLVPVPHPRLVEPAEFNGKPLSFIVPQGNKPLSSSFSVSSKPDGSRHAPEYVHVRIRVENDGTQTDLNNSKNVAKIVSDGNYRALHFVDFTGDGWVEASCPPLANQSNGLLGPLAAYSLVTAPDFFPTCDQRELMEWAATLPQSFSKRIWRTPPLTLSDQRLAANLQLPDSPFDKKDKTMTAIVSMFGEVSGQQTNVKTADALRHSPLPDDSAGVFAPGWDVSRDELADGTPHFAAYGLGSPFPEDAKLCAALSTFWPAAAPDATRTMEPELTPITVSPLTDEEIGESGHLPWDGISGPRVVQTASGATAEYLSLAHADYVQSALNGKFSLLLTSHIGVEEYQDRVVAMEVVYRAIRLKKDDWLVLSFRRVTPGDQELLQAQQESQTTLPGKVYRFEVFRNGTFTTPTEDFRKRRIKITDHRILFAGPDRTNPENSRVLMKKQNGPFTKA
jgi:hypothetical protein